MKTLLLVIGGLIIGAIVTTFVLSSMGQAPEIVINATDKVTDRLTEGIAPEQAPELTEAQKISAAVSAATPSTVTIHALSGIDDDLAGSAISALLEETFVARGVLVASNDSNLVTVISAGVVQAGTAYSVQIPGQKGVFLVGDIEKIGSLTRFSITAEKVRTLEIDSSEAVMDLPVVALGGKMELQIAGSVVKDVQTVNDERIIITAIPGALTPGTPLVNVEGRVIGVAGTTNENEGGVAFIGLEKDL